MSGDSPLRGRRVAVTGASGFIGARVVAKLTADHGAQVTAIARRRRRPGTEETGARAVQADLGDRTAIERAVADSEIVINLAYDFRAPGDDNVRRFETLLDACAASGTERFVQVSSIVVYDDWPDGDLTEASPAERPGTDYKNAKMAMERVLARRAAGGALAAAIIQPTIVYGPSSWIWTDRIVEQLAYGTVVLPDRAEGNCPAVYVDDVADAIILAAARQEGGCESYIVSGPAPVSWAAFFESYARALGGGSIRYVPAAELTQEEGKPPGGLRALIANPLQIANWGPVRRAQTIVRRAIGDAPVEKLRALVMNLRRRRGPVVFYPNDYEFRLYLSRGICRIDKARRELGYAPAYDFEAGSKPTADYIRRKYARFVKPGAAG